MQKRNSDVAIVDGALAGFSDVGPEGYIDMLFVTPQHQRQGVARRLIAYGEAHARRAQLAELTANVSITARPFFEGYGFTAEAEQQPVMAGVKLTNYRMKNEPTRLRGASQWTACLPRRRPGGHCARSPATAHFPDPR